MLIRSPPGGFPILGVQGRHSLKEHLPPSVCHRRAGTSCTLCLLFFAGVCIVPGVPLCRSPSAAMNKLPLLAAFLGPKDELEVGNSVRPGWGYCNGGLLFSVEYGL